VIVIPPRANAVERPDTDVSTQRHRISRRSTRTADEMASYDRLWQAVAGRDRDRPIQVDHQTSTAGKIVTIG
jgi:hypothetical protein